MVLRLNEENKAFVRGCGVGFCHDDEGNVSALGLKTQFYLH